MFTYRVCEHCTHKTFHGKYCEYCGRKLHLKHLRISTRLAALILTIVALGLGIGVALAASGTLQEQTHLAISASTTTNDCSGSYTYTATLTGTDGKGIGGKTVTVTRNKAPIDALTTDANGRISATHDITNCDANTLAAHYDGSVTYTQADATTTLNAKKPATLSISVPQTTAHTQTRVTVTLTDETDETPVANAVVRIIIGTDERYALTDNLGKATLPVTFSASGAYILKADYAGDDDYAHTSTSAIATISERSLAQQAEERKNSIAYIQSQSGLGAGVVIAHTKNKTIILTNRHVIETQPLLVQLDGEHTPTRVRNAPQNIDLAVIELEGLYGTPAPQEPHAKRGETVYALGNPQGLQGSVSAGIISNIYTTGNVTVLQTDTAINPGNSGGGLFNMHGELIGITTAKLRDTEGIGFAIGIDTLTRLSKPSEWN